MTTDELRQVRRLVTTIRDTVRTHHKDAVIAGLNAMVRDFDRMIAKAEGRGE